MPEPLNNQRPLAKPAEEAKSRPASFAAAVAGAAGGGSATPKSSLPSSCNKVAKASNSEHPVAYQSGADGGQPWPEVPAPAEERKLPTEEPPQAATAVATAKPRAWADVVAPWAKSAREAEEEKVLQSTLEAEAPEFVPGIWRGHENQHLHKVRSKPGGGISHDPAAMATDMLTTVVVSGVPSESTAAGFLEQLDQWGLGGCFDFFHLPLDLETGQSNGFAFINFIDPVFVMLYCWIYQECQLQGQVTMAELQGYEANMFHWCKEASAADSAQPTLLPNAMPTQWAVNAVNAMLSPQFKGQFRKTKMCNFNKKNRCELGPSCPFAHSKEELQPVPDLVKTKLCYMYFRRRCNDSSCKFAHGSAELRSVWMPMQSAAVPYSPAMWLPAVGQVAEWNPIGEGMLQWRDSEDLQGFFHSGDVAMMSDLPFMMQVSNSSEHSGGQADCNQAVRRRGESNQSSDVSRALFEVLPMNGDRGLYEDRDDQLMKAAANSSLPPGRVALRVRGTFMEAMEVDDEEEEAPSCGAPLKRCWSESNLAALREAMEQAMES